MIERVAHEPVTFLEPFFVEALGRELPAGTYEVETIEELIEGLSFLAYRVASTSVRIPLWAGVAHSYQMVRVDPSVVRKALRSSQEQSILGEPTHATPHE